VGDFLMRSGRLRGRTFAGTLFVTTSGILHPSNHGDVLLRGGLVSVEVMTTRLEDAAMWAKQSKLARMTEWGGSSRCSRIRS
jgi:hypothetical protein